MSYFVNKYYFTYPFVINHCINSKNKKRSHFPISHLKEPESSILSINY